MPLLALVPLRRASTRPHFQENHSPSLAGGMMIVDLDIRGTTCLERARLLYALTLDNDRDTMSTPFSRLDRQHAKPLVCGRRWG